MASANPGAVGKFACIASAIVLSIGTSSAHAITVDGDLSDLIAVVGTTNTVNYGYGADPLGSTEGTESNNGFDIENVYAYFDLYADVLYLGIDVFGTVGNSLPAGSSAINEGIANAGFGSNSKTAFDANETYSIQLYHGTSTSDPQLLLFNVSGANNDTDNVSAIANPWGLTINYSVSEAYNGVEFSISGLLATGAIPYINEQNLLIRFSAGSADTNSTSTAAEDSHLLQMQVVPVPAAAWLFGSGLLGLVAAARNRRLAK